MALFVLLLELAIHFHIVLLLARIVLIDASSHLFESLGLIIDIIIVIFLLFRLLLLLMLRLSGAAINPGSPQLTLGELLIRVRLLIFKLLDVNLL